MTCVARQRIAAVSAMANKPSLSCLVEPITVVAMVAQSTLALEQGKRYSGHYQNARPRSNQSTARREFTVQTGPHTDPKFRLGQVVKVIDQNALKTWYLHRIFDVQDMKGEPVQGENTAPLPILSPGTYVVMNRADTVDGSTFGRIRKDDGVQCTVVTTNNHVVEVPSTRVRPTTAKSIFRSTKRRRSRRLSKDPPVIS
jgi:hypothetical protein